VGVIRSVPCGTETNGVVCGSSRCGTVMRRGKLDSTGSGNRAGTRPRAASVMAGICLLLLAAVTATACGVSTSQQASVTPKAAPTMSAREAAKSYFAAMAPVIEKDLEVDKQLSPAMGQWSKAYANSHLTEWAPWQALCRLLQRGMPREEEILSGYEAVEVPPAFQRAHAALLADNRTGVAWGEAVIHDVMTQRPFAQWLPGVVKQAISGLTLDKRVVREFREAAAKLHLRVPAKLLKAYSQ
jgi:hypothetical protein